MAQPQAHQTAPAQAQPQSIDSDDDTQIFDIDDFADLSENDNDDVLDRAMDNALDQDIDSVIDERRTQAQQPREPDPSQARPNTVQQPSNQQQEQPTQTPTVGDNPAELRQWVQTAIPALQRENQQYREQAQNLQNELDRLRQANSLMQTSGVSTDDVRAGISLASQMKADPKGVAIRLLQSLKANGIEVEGGPNVGLGEAQVVRMLEERFGPLLRQQQEQEERRTREQTAQQEWDRFSVTYPNAVVHQDLMADVMQVMHQQGQPISLHDAYIKVMEWGRTNGLDLNKPLRPQVEARQNPQNNQVQPQPNNYSPGVRTMVGNVRNNATPASTLKVNENTPWESIIEEAYKEQMAKLRN